MDEEEKNESLSQIWKMCEYILERCDDLGQSFYDFGEKMKEIFGEKIKTKSIGKAPDSIMHVPCGSKVKRWQ